MAACLGTELCLLKEPASTRIIMEGLEFKHRAFTANNAIAEFLAESFRIPHFSFKKKARKELGRRKR